MNISVIDGSNYFKGLLLLISKDRRITESEIQLMKRIGKTLGFESEFCDTAIHDILENKYIVDEPPKFSTKELAIKFVRDGFAIARSDNELHPSEEDWLRSTAERNGLTVNWFCRESALLSHTTRQLLSLEVDDLSVEYS